MTSQMLTDLMAVAARWADGTVFLTKRANLQLRGIEHVEQDGASCVPAEFVEAITEAGFLPAPTHELVRNIVVSPRSALHDLAARFDDLLCADPALAALPARFLFSFSRSLR